MFQGDILADIGGNTLPQAIKRMFGHLMVSEVELQLVLKRPKTNSGKVAIKNLNIFQILSSTYNFILFCITLYHLRLAQ